MTCQWDLMLGEEGDEVMEVMMDGMCQSGGENSEDDEDQEESGRVAAGKKREEGLLG